MSQSAVLILGCVACGELREDRLYGRLDAQTSLCVDCWRAWGRPFPGPAPETPEQLRAVQDRMVRRGGADRYFVLAGKT